MMTNLSQSSFTIKLLQPLRQWLEVIEINSPHVARLLCKIIPASCPFARKIELFKFTIVRIPPLCKLNPLYEQIVSLRFKALSYLSEQCSENQLDLNY
jgi:hypothetical protein